MNWKLSKLYRILITDIELNRNIPIMTTKWQRFKIWLTKNIGFVLLSTILFFFSWLLWFVQTHTDDNLGLIWILFLVLKVILIILSTNHSLCLVDTRCVTANAFDHKNDDNDGNQLNRNALNRSKKSRRSSSFASLWRKNPEQSIEEIRNRKRLSSRSKSMRNKDSIKRNDEEREEKFKNGKRSLSMRLEAAPYHHRSQINSNQKCSNVKPKSSVEEEKKNLDQTSVIGNDHLSSFEASIISSECDKHFSETNEKKKNSNSN